MGSFHQEPRQIRRRLAVYSPHWSFFAMIYSSPARIIVHERGSDGPQPLASQRFLRLGIAPKKTQLPAGFIFVPALAICSRKSAGVTPLMWII